VAAQTIKLKSIEFYNFKSFLRGKYTFPEEGLISIEAENKETGGSSGAGKSTFLNAIAYALGYCEFPASTLKGWNSDDDMRVVLTLGTSDGDMEISKGSKNYLKVGGVTVTGAKAIEEKLRSIVGLDAETLKALVYRRQKSSGLFLTMDDSEKKEFLGKVMNLDMYEKAIEDTKEKLSKLKSLSSITEHNVNAIGDIEKPVEPFIPELVLDEHRDDIELQKKLRDEAFAKEQETAGKIDALSKEKEQKLSDVLKEYAPKESQAQSDLDSYADSYSFTPDTSELTACDTRIEKVKVRLEKVTKELQEAQKTHQDAVKAKSGEIAKLTHLASGFKHYQVTLDGLKKNKAKLEESVCFTCERDGFFSPQAKQTLDTQIMEVEKNLQMCVDASIQLPIAQKELDSLQPPSTALYDAMSNALATEQAKKKSIQEGLLNQQRDAKRQHELGAVELRNKLFSIQNEIGQKKTEIYHKYDSTISKLRQMESEFARETNNYKMRLIEAEHRLKKLHADHDIAMKQYKMDLGSYQTLQQMKDKLAKEKAEIELENGALELLKGFIGSIFEEILVEIADETNGILASIPNVSHCSVDFQTEAVTQKGTTKQRITTVVNVSGNSGPIKSVCSGGMETSIELAVDIAVAAVIARRTGASPQWIVLDEAFDGLDSGAKEACLEILQKHAHDKLVMVVSHVSDFREFFTSSIQIQYKDGKSEVV
jgi:DNA repair exonuclease SbcCD ATPase subunit